MTASPTPVFPPPGIGVDAEVAAAGADEVAEVDVIATEEERPLTTSAPPIEEPAEDDAVADSLDDAEVVTETAGAELVIEVAVVMTDGSPERGAELIPASVDAVELWDSIAEVTIAEPLMISDVDEATFDSSKPVEDASAMDEVTDDGAEETVPFPAVPKCEGFLHLPLPCPAA